MTKRGPKPQVEYDGKTYSCRCWNVEIPDLSAMDRFDALQWLCRETTPRGYSKPNPLAGLGDIISVSIR